MINRKFNFIKIFSFSSLDANLSKSAEQGFEESRLPQFTEDEMIEIQGSADFLGFNHYTSSLAYPTPPNQINPAKMGWDSDSDVLTFKDPKW